MPGEPPAIFFFTARNSLITPGSFIWLPWGWDGPFGGVLTITVGGKAFLARASIPAEHPAFKDLRDGKFTAVFVADGRALSALDVDLSELDGGESFCTHWTRVLDHRPVFPDAAAAYWHTLGCVDDLVSLGLTARDRLAIGWSNRFANYAQGLASAIEDARPIGFPDLHKPVPPPLGDFIAALGEADVTVAKLVEVLARECTRGDAGFMDLIAAEQEYLALAHSKTTEHTYCRFFGHALQVYCLTSAVTAAGQRVPWLDGSGDLALRFLDLHPEQFPDADCAAAYWGRLPKPLSFNLGIHVSGTDIPIDLESKAALWDTFPVAENVAEVSASADTLMEEALASKATCIPNGAVIEMSFGPFAWVEAWERGQQVDLVCRSPRAEFAIATLHLGEKVMIFQALHAMPPVDRTERIEAAAKLLFAAIVRDFFIVEERERVFSEQVRRRLPGERENRDDPIIVYLPRVKYRAPPDIQKCSTELKHAERRAHFVAAHLRRAGGPSQHQLLLAARYGIEVPIGYTFVRPHERGHKARDTIYRSRSAMRSLCQATEEKRRLPGPVDWFRFERDARSLMENLGFSVEHVSASRSGDKGIDIYATKGADLDEVRWIIQCKCYSPKTKIGPAIVRELIGALAPHQGTRGMLISTSSFTSGAREVADANAIRLMDGQEFARRVAAGDV